MKTSIAITTPWTLLVLCLGLAPVTAQIVAEHPGACPFVDFTLIKCQTSDPQCSFDSECKPDQKCCNTGCVVTCVKSDPVHAGVCPVVDRTLIKCRMPPPFRNCTSDTQCQADEKCCDAGCQVTCVKSETDHPGACPFVDYTVIKCQMPPPKPQCSFDSECKPDHKCCNTGCVVTCVKSDPVHAGVCPFVDRTLIKCRMPPRFRNCTSDTQCQADEKCCDSGCRFTCVKSKTEKAGVCPLPGTICDEEFLQRTCHDDGDCPDARKCCRLSCSIGCEDPRDSDYPSPLVNNPAPE